MVPQQIYLQISLKLTINNGNILLLLNFLFSSYILRLRVILFELQLRLGPEPNAKVFSEFGNFSLRYNLFDTRDEHTIFI